MFGKIKDDVQEEINQLNSENSQSANYASENYATQQGYQQQSNPMQQGYQPQFNNIRTISSDAGSYPLDADEQVVWSGVQQSLVNPNFTSIFMKVFAIIWLTITTIIFASFFSMFSDVSQYISILPMVLFTIPFFAVGIFLFVRSFSLSKKSKKGLTKKTIYYITNKRIIATLGYEIIQLGLSEITGVSLIEGKSGTSIGTLKLMVSQQALMQDRTSVLYDNLVTTGLENIPFAATVYSTLCNVINNARQNLAQ